MSHRTMTRAASILVAIGALALLPSEQVRACSCVAQEPAAALAAAVAVFEGVLLHHRDSPAGSVSTFRVERVWKGEVPREHAVLSPGPNSMCPPHFEAGQRYIVYVDSGPEGPHVRACARYAFGANIARERAALGRPIRTYPAR